MNMYAVFAITLAFLWSVVQIKVSAPCPQVYPSEYAYRGNSVFRAERASAMCTEYPTTLTHRGTSPEDYFHCGGTQLKLTDSDIGSELYSGDDYYVWPAETMSQLLFIFPTRVNLTTITLHYYSDSIRGRPRLRFYTVPDDFDAWDAPHASYSYVDVAEVPPGGDPAGQRNVSVVTVFIANTIKILMYKSRSSFVFAVSEAEFTNCCSDPQSCTDITKDLTATTNYLTSTLSVTNTTVTSAAETKSRTSNFAAMPTTDNTDTDFNYSNTIATYLAEDTEGKNALALWIAVGIVIAILVVLTCMVTIAIIVLFLKKFSQKESEYDDSYSTLCREPNKQLQPQSLHLPNDLYDRFELSPSTGQAEFVVKTETDKTNNPSPHHYQRNTNFCVDTEQPKSSAMQIIVASSQSILSQESESILEQPTYAVVNKEEKKMKKKVRVHCSPEKLAAANFSSTKQNGVCNQQRAKSPEEFYTAVRKKTKESTAQNEEEQPPIPPQGVEQFYTAVNKKTQPTTANDEVESPPIPPHTVEELYTAVMKKPKARETDDEVEAPPVPPHTVEELYTAVQKNKK